MTQMVKNEQSFPTYQRPPRTLDWDGNERRVGIEIEFAGPRVSELAEISRRIFPGREERISDYEWKLHSEEFGSFVIEVDSSLIKEAGRQGETSGNWVDELYAYGLGTITRGWVPCEIVSPPLPISRLDVMDRLVEAVRQEGGKGTMDSIWNAFGLHFNPDVPSLDVDSIRSYLQAFVCSYDWLVEHGHVDISRRVTPYINPFEEDYLEVLLAADYKPDINTFIDDYLEYNPTRNRALDLLPLIMFIDEDRLRSVVDDPRVKSRPTFHYRLPNCDIDNPKWGIWEAWNHWVLVETLAEDRDRLAEACAAYLKHLDSYTPDFIRPWREQVEAFLIPEDADAEVLRCGGTLRKARRSKGGEED